MGSDSIFSKMESDPISDPISRSRRRCVGALAAGPALGALGPLGIAACAHRGQPSPTPASPPLWRLAPPPGGTGAGWLFGSVHAGIAVAEAMPSTVERAWAAADVLAIEIDVAARWTQLRDLFAQAALLPGTDTIEGLLGATRAAEIREHFGFDDARWLGLRRLAPWALAVTLAGNDPLRRERTGGQGIETRFIDSARSRAMPIVELEQAGEQVTALAGGSLEAQAAWLWRRFEAMRRQEDLAAATLAAWRAGDEARLAALKTRAWGEANDAAMPRPRMFGERDRRIAKRLARLLERPHTVFTVVGAFHLAGEDGLPGILAAHGVRVERVPPDRGES